MDQNGQRNNNDASEIYPVKRRPGRPRKYLRPNVNFEENAMSRVHNLQRQENAPIRPDFVGVDDKQLHHANANAILPGFAGVNYNQPHQVNANAIMVGQGVHHGVIDAPFDAGNLPPAPILSAHPVPENKVVPVVLQPFNFSTGGTVADQIPPVFPTAPLQAYKGKQVAEGSSNASKPTSQVETVGNQVLPSPPTKNIMNDNIDMDPLFVEPLRTVHADPTRPASLPKTSENLGTGKMTEPSQDDGGHSNVGGPRKRACSICGQKGHNRKTCRNRQI